jgi:hypothetical protein
METSKKIIKHKKQSIHYLENAFHLIELGETEKASELLWGSMTQALKAAAMTKDKLLRSHYDMRNYAMEFRKAGYEDIYRAFNTAQSLHSNFYETGLSMEDVVIGAEEIKSAVAKLLSQIPEESE